MVRLAAGIGQASSAKEAGTFVTVGAASVQIVASNGGRSEVTICNDHATQVLYLSLGGTAVVGSGIRVNAAGGSYTTNAYSGAINGIASGAATNVCVSEV